jgi:hypothetical protein
MKKTGIRVRIWGAVTAVMLLCAGPSFGAPPDPISGTLDPPPGPLDYVKALSPGRWVFGELLWRGREPCTEAHCEAAYNADPVFILVQREANCCGESSYSLTVIGRAENCPAVSYYLVFSGDIVRLNKGERVSLVSRHVASVASSIRSACKVEGGGAIPTADLEKLFP